jgi:hypothetical protein
MSPGTEDSFQFGASGDQLHFSAYETTESRLLYTTSWECDPAHRDWSEFNEL